LKKAFDTGGGHLHKALMIIGPRYHAMDGENGILKEGDQRWEVLELEEGW